MYKVEFNEKLMKFDNKLRGFINNLAILDLARNNDNDKQFISKYAISL